MLEIGESGYAELWDAFRQFDHGYQSVDVATGFPIDVPERFRTVKHTMEVVRELVDDGVVEIRYGHYESSSYKAPPAALVEGEDLEKLFQTLAPWLHPFHGLDADERSWDLVPEYRYFMTFTDKGEKVWAQGGVVGDYPEEE